MKIYKCVTALTVWLEALIHYWRSKVRNVVRDIDILKYRNTKGIPVIILDLKTKKSLEYASVAEAARFFHTYPEKIWKVVREKKLYLNRYKIKVNSYVDINYIEFYALFIILCVKFFKFVFRLFKANAIFIIYMLLSLILGLIIYKYMLNILIVYKNAYDEYVNTICKIRVDYLRCVLEHRFSSYNNNNVENARELMAVGKNENMIGFNNRVFLKNTYGYKYLKSINNLGICQQIINEVNLNFNDNFSGIVSSPIIDRVDPDRVFNKLIGDIVLTDNSESVNNNSLGIYSNRNSLRLDTSIVTNGPNKKELLNYESNILYLLINRLSPSIY